MNPQVSLFASAIRPKLWHSIFKSLEGTTINWEIVFSGNTEFNNELIPPNNFKYIYTKNIKPAQCYEIARRQCRGELVVWTADDAEYPNDIIGKAYNYWKSKNNKKLILSLQTKESGYGNPHGSLFNMDLHRFFGGDFNTPLMAPLGMMSREFLNELGGIDRRYIAGQYENDILMRAYTQGATVEIFGDNNCYIDIDHLGKSISIGESTNESDFRNRPFATGYEHDRKILEGSWAEINESKFFGLISKGHKTLYPSQFQNISNVQLDIFEPYSENISLIESEGPHGQWE